MVERRQRLVKRAKRVSSGEAWEKLCAALGELGERIEIVEAQVKSLQLAAPRGIPVSPPSCAEEKKT